MPKRKRGGRGWDNLSWKATEVQQASLGDADDCFMFTLEEVDGSHYIMEKDDLGGIKVRSRDGGKKSASKKKKRDDDDDDDDEEEEGSGSGEEEVAVPSEDEEEGGGEEEQEVEEEEGEEEEDGMEGAPMEEDDSKAAATTKKEKKKEKAKKKRERRREKKRQKLEEAKQEATGASAATKATSKGSKSSSASGSASATPTTGEETAPVDLPAWSSQSLGGVELHPLLVRNLARQGFVRPTPIQQATIPLAIKSKDVMGAAETGSGKTLAYGLPVLDALLKRRDQGGPDMTRGPLAALVLCPTRELAMQVTAHLKEMLVGDEVEGKRKINVVNIVGGLADVKQERMLARKPEVVVATVGRLWELMSSNEPHLKNLSQLRFLVLDEADRMVEQGHYPELGKLLGAMMDQQRAYLKLYQERVQGKKKMGKDFGGGNRGVVDGDEEEGGDDMEGEMGDDDLMAGEVPVVMLDDVLRNQAQNQQEEEEDEEEGQEDEEEEEEEVVDMAPPVKRQTLIFSATLVMPEDLRKGKGKKAKASKGGQGNIVAKIMRRVGLRGKPAIVDLTTTGGAAAAVATTTTTTTTATKAKAGGGKTSLSLPEGLRLSYVKTVPIEKDLYTYYFLRHYPGRTLIFTNSIENVRRLSRLLVSLAIPCRALHAKLQQRQRLKSMDQFRSSPQAVLVATDVAARGLDIPQVDHVIHYDLPRSLEIFVHRSGRTARAQREGVSFSLVGPRDERMHQEVVKTLLPPDSSPMPSLPIDLVALGGCRERVSLAGRVVKYELEDSKRNASQSWLAKAAKDAELDLEEEEGEDQGLTQAEKVQRAQLVRDKERLTELLKMPLVVERKKFFDVASKIAAIEESQGKTAIEAIEGKKRKKKGPTTTTTT